MVACETAVKYVAVSSINIASPSNFSSVKGTNMYNIRQAEKWALDKDPELRDLITAAADNVAAGNDIQRYYNQVFHRLSSTLALCVKEEAQLESTQPCSCSCVLLLF
jgi:hypothetical protein